MMRLNDLSPAPGHKTPAKRVGRGIGSGLGKTCGRGHKGQKARKSGNVRPGFEGGQMPLQKRLPKYGFTSRIGLTTSELRTSELNKLSEELVTLDALKVANFINVNTKRVKIFLSGEVTKKFNVKGLMVTAGARKAIEDAGGSIED
jgi:large subunit ribosomal protein L15